MGILGKDKDLRLVFAEMQHRAAGDFLCARGKRFDQRGVGLDVLLEAIFREAAEDDEAAARVAEFGDRLYRGETETAVRAGFSRGFARLIGDFYAEFRDFHAFGGFFKNRVQVLHASISAK